MSLDVKGFVTPEQNFEGMYRTADTMRENKLLQERKAQQEYERQKEEKGKTAASMRYFANYLDPKDRYTGTYYDPKMNELLGDALSQAYDLAGKGAGEVEILTAISPLVNKANIYQQKAKMYSDGKKQFLDSLKQQKGYNTANLGKYMDEVAFDGQNIDDVDPTDILGFANKAFQKYGSQITTDEALNDYIKKLPTSQITSDVISYNSRGGRQRNKAMIDMPNIFQQEEENGVSTFVPKYDKATDFGEDIVGTFEDGKGGKVDAPVRLLDEKVFDSIINDNPAIKHRVESMVQDALNSGEYKDGKGNVLSLTSPQAKNLGRALLYDELKNKSEIKRNIIQETKPAQVRNTTVVNMPGGATQQQITGNEFDRLPKPGIKKDWLGRDTKKPGRLTPSDIPERVYAILKTAGMDVNDAVEFDAELNDSGEIESITPYFDYSDKDAKQKDIRKGSKITRQDMFDAQLKYNSEPQKGQQPTFGTQNQNKPASNNSKTYSLKGKTYTQKQVENAAKQSGMTVDEYLKAAGFK